MTDHETVYAELGVQATAYQTGVPPVIAAESDGQWRLERHRASCLPSSSILIRSWRRLGAMGMPWHMRDEDTGDDRCGRSGFRRSR